MSEPLQTQAGAHPAMNDWHGSRSATRQAAFFLPYLKAGMRLLDMGSGPGSITVGLAELVAPGEVVGVDLDPRRVEAGRKLAAEQGVANVTFEVGDATSLRFPDASFDAVFEHQTFFHIKEPAKAAAEAFRLLKPGGVFGGRDTDWGGILLSPFLSQEWNEGRDRFFLPFLSRKGSNYYFGRRLAATLLAAAFTNVLPTASYQMEYNTPETRAALTVAERLADDPEAVAFGLACGYTVERFVEVNRARRLDPGCFYALSACEAVGWKPA